MEARDLLELYNKVAPGKNNLPKMEDGTFSLQSTPAEMPIASAELAYKKLVDFEPIQGWIGFQSVNLSFTSNDPVPQMDDETGKLLAAEAVNRAGESLHIRYDGAGGWIVTHYKVEKDGDSLADTVIHIANNKKLGKLRYRRFWRIDPEHGAEPYAACFIGFAEE